MCVSVCVWMEGRNVDTAGDATILILKSRRGCGHGEEGAL